MPAPSAIAFARIAAQAGGVMADSVPPFPNPSQPQPSPDDVRRPQPAGPKTLLVVGIFVGVIALLVIGGLAATVYFFFDRKPVSVSVRIFTPMPVPARTPTVAAATPARATARSTVRVIPTLPPNTTASFPSSRKDLPLYRDGAFGFPQREATVLCDRPDLRLSVWSNTGYLYAQAIVWGDGDSTLGRTSDGKEIGDHSVLMLSLQAHGVATPEVDRNYMLNPWPAQPGLRYVVQKSGGTSGIQGNTEGRGAIRYETLPTGQKVRVDSFLIPLGEISKQVGNRLSLAYWTRSPEPALTLNSTATTPGPSYYSYSVPRVQYHQITLQTGHAINVFLVPDDKSSPAVPRIPPQRLADTPKVASSPSSAGPPEGTVLDIKFTAADGREVDLAKLRGKVVLIDFWATWCGPCIAELPHVLEAYAKYHDRGFEIVGISFDSDRAKLTTVTGAKQMTWPQFFDGKGWQNQYGQQYGIHGIPTMWLVDKQGKLATKTARQNLAEQVAALLDR
jgi:thiol-disulfide isomerase/thioredoxin